MIKIFTLFFLLFAVVANGQHKSYEKQTKDLREILKKHALAGKSLEELDLLLMQEQLGYEDRIKEQYKQEYDTRLRLKNSKQVQGDNSFVSVEDSLALVAFYASTNGPGWTDNSNWLTGPVHSWFGLEVSGGEVRGIDLYNNNLNGTIPSEFWSLTSLWELDLDFNDLSGVIPSAIGNLTFLNYLDLGSNNFTGTIPNELGNLIQLHWLDLGSNEFEGDIPIALSNLINLSVLRMGYNNFTGTIPIELASLHNLNELYLGRNNLEGEIPPELGNLAYLEGLRLFSNQLTGNIPSELGNLVNLRELYLDNNELDGNIPIELYSLENLYDLRLGWNNLSGSIPSEIGNLINIGLIQLRSNQLTGVLPPEIGNLANLYRLSLSENQLSGEIPSELGNLLNLQNIDLSLNLFTGEIPMALTNLKKLTNVHLGKNKLVGSIPKEFGQITTLYVLSLGSNNFTGSIPAELGNLDNLASLVLQDNELTGEVPEGIWGLSKLFSIGLANNQLTGTLPTNISKLSNLYWLSIENNNFSGELPTEILSLTTLGALEVNGNNFSGELPAELGSHNAFFNVNLAYNNFEGPIPTALNNCADLYYLNIKSNDFSSLPDLSATGLTTFLADSNKLSFNDFDKTGLDFSTLEEFTYGFQDTLMLNYENLGFNYDQQAQVSVDTLTTPALSNTNNEYLVAKEGVVVNDWSYDPVFTIDNYTEEHTGKYTFQVRNSDYSDLILQSDTIILKKNNAPTDLSLSQATIEENSSVGTLVGELSTTDEDLADVHTYSLVAGDGTNDADNAMFAIEGRNLISSTALDYENKQSHSIYVQCSDRAGATFEKAFEIKVTNVVETSIEEIPAKVKVYPNPSNGKFTIKTASGGFVAKVYDAIGNLVVEQKSHATTLNLDLSGLASGICFLHIEGANTNTYKKIIIQ